MSSNFVLYTERLTDEQINMVLNYQDYAKDIMDDYTGEEDVWEITQEEDCIKGSTTDDNFAMCIFMKRIRIPSAVVEFSWN